METKASAEKGLIRSDSQGRRKKTTAIERTALNGALTIWRAVGQGPGARSPVLNETDAGHWPCPGTPSPGGGRQTFKDTLEQLVKLYCVMGRGGAAWEASGGD